VIWSDDSAQEGISALLSAEVDELIEVNLADQWRQYDEVTSRENPMIHHPDLTLSDHLRCRDLIENSTNRAAQSDLSDIDAYAALIGPLASVNVLTRAVELPEESIREILGNAGWLEVDHHPQAGARFAPPSPEFWRAALLAGGARAHRCAASLQEGLEHVYLGESLMEVRSALQRLSTLRGRGAYRGQVSSALDLESASDALDAIAPAITISQPSPLSLMTLCGLALDWAKLGPLSGRWDDALHALKLGVASAQRLKDPQRAAQLLFMLGKLSLDDGRASIADEALSAALSIFKVTQRADETCRSAQLLAEASLLRGEVDQALSRLSEAQQLALQLSLPREAWRSRFRAGQLWASLGDHQQSLSLWSTLRPAQDQESNHDHQRALLALTLECAASLLHLNRASEAWDWLERSQTQAPFGQALLSVCRWRMSSEDVVTLLRFLIKKVRINTKSCSN
jgi:tetratricopeptide (TPR) repeat protein